MKKLICEALAAVSAAIYCGTSLKGSEGFEQFALWAGLMASAVMFSVACMQMAYVTDGKEKTD